MPGLIDRIGSLAGTELGKAVDLAHRHYQERMGVHRHTGRALIETVAEVARNHPNLVGVGVGLLVEQFLAEQKRRHDTHMAELEGEAEEAAKLGAAPPPPKPPGPHGLPNIHHPLVPHDLIKLHTLRPGKIAFEVFGALILLKLASSGLRMFRHDKQHEVWFAPAARIRLWSGTFAAYNLVKALKAERPSAWRNAFIALFATDALKPVLRAPKRKKGAQPSYPAPPPPSVQPAPALPPPPAAAPTVNRGFDRPAPAPIFERQEPVPETAAPSEPSPPALH